jgi:hypothetical protein
MADLMTYAGPDKIARTSSDYATLVDVAEQLLILSGQANIDANAAGSDSDTVTDAGSESDSDADEWQRRWQDDLLALVEYRPAAPSVEGPSEGPREVGAYPGFFRGYTSATCMRSAKFSSTYTVPVTHILTDGSRKERTLCVPVPCLHRRRVCRTSGFLEEIEIARHVLTLDGRVVDFPVSFCSYCWKGGP